MAQLQPELRFIGERALQLGVVQKLVAHALERDLATGARIDREPHARHAARRQRTNEVISAERICAGRRKPGRRIL